MHRHWGGVVRVVLGYRGDNNASIMLVLCITCTTECTGTGGELEEGRRKVPAGLGLAVYRWVDRLGGEMRDWKYSLDWGPCVSR